MLPRNLEGDFRRPQFHTQELADGIPLVSGLAMLCSRVISGMQPPPLTASMDGAIEQQTLAADSQPSHGLVREALAILAAAAKRGILEIRGQADAFDSSQRLQAVAVETSEHHRLVFRSRIDPAITMAYLEGFRQLCETGCVVHQFSREFSLSSAGFSLARKLKADDFVHEWEAAIEEEI